LAFLVKPGVPFRRLGRVENGGNFLLKAVDLGFHLRLEATADILDGGLSFSQDDFDGGGLRVGQLK
jgi:hypothetical protein